MKLTIDQAKIKLNDAVSKMAEKLSWSFIMGGFCSYKSGSSMIAFIRTATSVTFSLEELGGDVNRLVKRRTLRQLKSLRDMLDVDIKLLEAEEKEGSDASKT